MSHIDVSHVTYLLPDGRALLDNVSFRVGDRATAGLVGPNGAGKTTLLHLIAGDLAPAAGDITTSGGLGVMRQFIGSVRDHRTVHDLLLSVAPDRIRHAAAALADSERGLREHDDEATQMRYADAVAEYVDAGGYDLEVVWDAVTTVALALPYDQAGSRDVNTLSGGEQKRLVLEALLRGPDQLLLLDEPDNYLDVPGKQWLEQQLRASTKTILLVSHDRQLLAEAADRIVTVEDRQVWVHGGGFATYAQARRDHVERLDEHRRRWEDEHTRLRQHVHATRQGAARNDALASTYRAAQTRLARFEAAGPPTRPPREQNVRIRLRGGRTGKQSVICHDLELTGLMKPFDLEIWYGERVAVLGSNGSGKSQFLKLLAEAGHQHRETGGTGPVPHRGEVRLGTRVVPGLFTQTHARPDLDGRTPADILMTDQALIRNDAMAALARYEIAPAWNQPFQTLSGGQQARLQILLLELSGATLLLLDEPTDNLDLASADALQRGLEGFAGTVITVTHDRWFAAHTDRYLVFGADATVYESDTPVWNETRVDRAR
ncbi:ATP-binding cassette domain-containing protein [Dactylosporangium sp. NPDC051485]|uniref:ABC-F family ATP-binding cassette domain-containing protein n=1 Tax=Dactylosporangium sp. NPDC051485 TaxID=3154846 RepID=UPI00342B88E1